MNRVPFALCTLALAAVLAAAGGQGAGATFQERYAAFQKRLDAERAKTGLGYDALRRKYPTPELSLVSAVPASEGSRVCLAPGKTAKLVLDAKVVPGSFIDFNCDALTVVDQKLEGGKLRLEVRARPDAMPGRCDLLVASAGSGIQASLPLVQVVGRYTWELQLANGTSSRWVVDATRCEDAADLRGVSRWSRQGKAQGERPVALSGSGGAWRAQVEPTPEEQQALSEELTAQSSSERTNAAMEKINALSQKMGEECVKLKPEQMQPCFEKYQKLLEPHQKVLQAAGDQMKEASTVRKVGCHELQLTVGEAGAVTGTGEGCGAPGETAVKGKVAVSAASAP
ncbi:hypothetical protein FGE12_12050 [Aggregicoccus sp. 17bor-14]|uniref:hypothetical protein n=1 Tax=Myxococcaceae TaxID=31 RepID=UPI00129CA1E9|nr:MULTISPECIES: hypothetical protein [Myxococcaceae]MBF5043121.1 hypothetical protein [Simulacricoccus sp. 17bor-14]MRI88883.1 hypothetical protein [Aggregicoccus sp. 17bor-14]